MAVGHTFVIVGSAAIVITLILLIRNGIFILLIRNSIVIIIWRFVCQVVNRTRADHDSVRRTWRRWIEVDIEFVHAKTIGSTLGIKPEGFDTIEFRTQVNFSDLVNSPVFGGKFGSKRLSNAIF